MEERTIAVWAWADRRPAWVIAVALACGAFLYLWNLRRAPDFLLDETLYVQAARNVGNGNSLTFGDDPISVHPPLFFVTLAGWLAVFGGLQTPMLDGVAVARHLNVVYDLLVILLVALLARSWSRTWTPARRGCLLVVATALTALNPFLLRFGRAVLLEPMALAAGLLALLVAWRMRQAHAVLYATVVGAVIGVALLTKLPVLFLVAAPLAAAALQRDWRALGRHVAALLVGGVVFAAFPIWAYRTGFWVQFTSQQGESVRRLLGILQTTGLNRPGLSPFAAVWESFGQFVGGYLVFAIGGCVLVVALWQALRRRTPVESGAAQILALGVVTYGFLGYSTLIGQANQHLTDYAVPASTLLVAGAPGILTGLRLRGRRFRVHLATAVCTVVALLVCAVSWLTSFGIVRDDAAAQAEAYISRNLPPCAAVNSTGNTLGWEWTLRTNPITSYSSGRQAVANDVRIFLDSPKDAMFHYGPSNAELSNWLAENGRRVFSVASPTHQRLSVYVVGEPVTPVGQSLPGCVAPLPQPVDIAAATAFGTTLGATLGADALVALVAWPLVRRGGRHREKRSRAHRTPVTVDPVPASSPDGTGG
ncbi:ArnT family glycosyltransferase [Modestobacter marinus]|uniref:ArnT family glycosyltransferase n=1 Tax=Modestobacter marinus TaxID=477641 RepID=UPI001C96783E|nr:hypothetical protein [Modestobacter marinus]